MSDYDQGVLDGHRIGFRDGIEAAAKYVEKWWGGGADVAKALRALAAAPKEEA